MLARVASWSMRYRDMLFSSVSPRQRIVTLWAWLAKNSAACPAELPAPTIWTSRPWVFDASLRAAPYEMPFPTSGSKPSIERCRQDTPQASTIVRACKTSPLSRCTWRLEVSMRVIDRVTTISAPSRRACCSARVASSSPDTPDGKPR
jgi:hypothetical protein